ncbi:FxSxx-COOH system tetratricopeptide repeat protein [Krasilnikovia sp. MM14-A1259]|uniref:FxSxx-COOH system tetratricopeptide repeat protein n=1 Tax=Krasilnikovia sp. MM14-A1259 TaxID=3373539 RepID=UPI00399C586B
MTNLAWLLARRGRNTVVLELSTEGAQVHDYLGPFFAEAVTTKQLFGPRAAELLDVSGRTDATACRYLVGPGRLDVVRTRTFGVEIAQDLRETLHEAPYDYILVDASTENSASTLAATAVFSDRVAVCLRPKSSSVREAARLTERLFDQRPVNFPPVLVAGHFGADAEQADRSLADIDREFGPLLGGGSSSLVTLPSQPYYDYLALLKEPAGSPLRDAYTRLATALTQQDPAAPCDVSASLSNRYVVAMDLRAGSGRMDGLRERMQVHFHPADQYWTEWLSRQLGENGIKVEPCPTTGTSPRPADRPVVVVTSRAYGLAEVNMTLAAWAADGATPELIVVALPGGAVPTGGPPFTVVDLTDEPSEEAATSRLFGALGMAGAAHPAAGGPRRLFAGPERVNAIPAQETPFLGRDHEIGVLREHLSHGHRVVVRAPGGMGKTALAREYYERFAADYDTVWWIPAHDVRAVRRTLMRLGDDLAVRPRGDMVAATLEVLGADHRTPGVAAPGRWLLVYDGVTDLEVLNGLCPAGGNGHVVITTQDEASVVTGSALALGRLDHKELVNGLIALVEDVTKGQAALTEDAAVELVRAVRGAPMGVRLACTYLRRILTGRQPQSGAVVTTAAELLRTAVEALRTTATQNGLEGLLTLVLELLHQDPYGVRAHRLAEMCGFLSPAGVDVRLWHAPAMLEQFARASGGDDGTDVTADDIDRTIWTGTAFGLLSFRWQDLQPLRTVPALQRMLLDRMTPEDRVERCRQVRRGLAGVANALPWEADTRMRTSEARWTAAIHAELQRHLAACAAFEDDELSTRQWVVRQFRYLIRTADQANLRYAAPLLTDILERWRAAHPTDLLTLRLANELTNVLRGLGRYREALSLDELMLRQFVAPLRRDHFRILVVRRGIAADQRALGQFATALALDQATWKFVHDTHGSEHPETLTTGHNLAVSQFLAGQVAVALVTEQQVHEGRRRILGETARQSMWSEMEIGIYTRELGAFEAAASLLLVSDKRMQQAGLPRQHTLRLRARRHWAIAHRLAGNAPESPGPLQMILQAYEDLFGPDHPQSWATRLSVAAEEYDAGHATRAAELASSVLAHYEADLGEHPFTAAARANTAVYLQGAGMHADAAAHARRAHEGLLRLLGEPHPWTISALLGRVLVEAEQQNHVAAAGLAEEAYGLAWEFLPNHRGMPRHPHVQLATEWHRRLQDDQAINLPVDWPIDVRRYIEITIPET